MSKRKNFKRFNQYEKVRKYRASKFEQGLFTTRRIGEAAIQLTAEQETLAKQAARLWAGNLSKTSTNQAISGIQKRNLNRNERLGVPREK